MRRSMDSGVGASPAGGGRRRLVACRGRLDVRVGHRFALADAADAHRAIEGRSTTGKVLLVPAG